MSNIGIKRENDRVYKNGSFPEMRSETIRELPELPEIKRSTAYSVAENTVSETTVQSIIRNAGEALLYDQDTEGLLS